MSGGGEVKKKGRGVTWMVGKKKERKKKKEREKKVVHEWWGKKKKKRGKIQWQQRERECGRKIKKKGILGVVKYKRK